MGSIPLLALDVKTPEQPDLLQKYGQLEALRNQSQQIQMQQQEAPLRLQALQQGVQTGQIGLQQQQQAQKDQESFRAAMQDPSLQGKTIGQVADVLAQKGQISQGGWAQAKKADLEHSEAVQKLDTAKLANIKAAHDQTQQLYNNVMDMPDDQLAANWPQIAQQVNAIPGNEKMPLNPNQPMTKQQLGQFGPMLGMANSYLDQELARRQKQAELAAEQAKPQQAAATAAETARHNAADEKAAQQRLSIEGARLNFEKAKQGTQDASAIEAQAQQIAKFEVKGLSQSRNNPYSRAVMQRVYEINPGYSDEGYATNQDFLSSKGKANAQVQSLNKLSAHLEELRNASNNAGFSPVGFTSAGKDLRLAEQLFSKEDVKFLSGSGVGTEGELNGLIEKTHSPIQSVRDSAINTLSRFTADAARQLGDQYERGTKQKFDPNQHFTPTTVQMMQKSGGTSARESQQGGGMVTVQIPGSPPGQIPAAGLAKFKADHPNAQVQQ